MAGAHRRRLRPHGHRGGPGGCGGRRPCVAAPRPPADCPHRGRGELRMADTTAQFLHTWSVLNWFRAHPEGTLMQAAADLGTSVAQIRHELRQLSLCGLPGHYPGSLVEVAIGQTGASVEFTAGLDGAPILTTVEAGVLLLSLQSLRAIAEPDRQASIDSVMGKIHTVLQNSREQVDRHLGGLPSADSGQVASPRTTRRSPTTDTPPAQARNIAALRQAIAQRRTVTGTYHSLSSDRVGQRVLIPDLLSVIDGNTYLFAREVDPSGQVPETHRTFALARLEGVQLGEPGSAPERQEPDVDPDDPFALGSTENWAELSLHRTAAWMLEYFPLFVDEDDREDGSIKTDDEGDIPVYIPDTGEWLDRFVVAYCQELAGVHSAEVAARIHERTSTALAVYETRSWG
ncbi:WYL domain-containing protein [Corynebacterium heidelbergense]|uniref:WYL domain-containing protein n=2 Tax=Corynebacterium heidelbergense TaxID=2055947 RepID=A0A364V4F7_9CORY|nr:WYL domain-containing protein [Corynebacterium heidelbergense]